MQKNAKISPKKNFSKKKIKQINHIKPKFEPFKIKKGNYLFLL